MKVWVYNQEHELPDDLTDFHVLVVVRYRVSLRKWSQRYELGRNVLHHAEDRQAYVDHICTEMDKHMRYDIGEVNERMARDARMGWALLLADSDWKDVPHPVTYAGIDPKLGVRQGRQ